MAELLPCPFCGGKAYSYFIEPHKHILIKFPDHEGSGYVECVECTCIVCADTEEKAIELWNTRTPKEMAGDT